MADPILTVIAVFFEMRREAARTLYTLSPEYQRGVRASDYEVLAIDNGSTDPLTESEVTAFGPNFRLVSNPGGEPYPGPAINRAASEAASPWVMCLIDGARMLSPGIIKGALAAFREEPEPFVYTIGMHIGRHSQNALVESARLAVGPSEESLAARVRYLEGTWSWRITRPLRAAGTLARRARRRGASQPEPPGDPGAVKPIPGPQKQSLLVEWIRRIEDSRSWSITRPLRALAVLVKRALRRPINRPRPPTVSDEFVRAYRRAEEDWLLDSVDWRRNGYLLFTISTPAASVGEHGFHSPVRESNCFALRRTTFLDGGGFDERFRSPGGGLVNLDLFERFVENPRISPICLLGEATFHQFHGGVATNVRMQDHPWESFAAEYEAIRGRPYTSPNGSEPLYVGKVPKEARHLVRGD